MDEINNENNEIMKKELTLIGQKLLESLKDYRKTMSYMAADVPIGVLCLPKVIENALFNAGCLRVYDLLDRDLTKIKGMGSGRIKRLTSCLDQFISMS